MRPDPGRALLDDALRARTPAERARRGQALREQGIALVWQQLDRAGIDDPIGRVAFLLDRMYPEMPPVHREQIRRRLAADLAAGRWDGPRRPAFVGDAVEG